MLEQVPICFSLLHWLRRICIIIYLFLELYDQGASEAVEAVTFSFMTAKEVRRHSVMKVTNPNLLDLVGCPTPGGLYDPALGPSDERAQ